jgi:hypothetical protein
MDATATSGGEIGRAMQKVAGQAGALGIPFEKIASYIAVISSRTRESAESIGTSMKSLLARFQNITETGFNEEDETKINDVAKALNSVGIAFTDVNGEIRRFDVVIEELGTKWDKLDSTTQAYLATTLSGARQQSRFYNLMDGLQEATKLYNNSLLATTTTQDKFNVYLESNEAKLNTFKARMEEMWLNTFNDQNLGKIIEFGTSIVSLIDNIGLLNLAVVAAGTAFIIYLDKINKAILAVKALNPEIAIAVSVIGALMFAIGKYNEHQQKMYDNAVKNAQALSEESRKSTDLLNSISNLYDKQKLSNDERDRLKTVQSELQKMYPDVLSNLDLEKTSYEDLEEAVKNATNAKREQALLDIQTQKTKLQNEIKNMQAAEERWALRGLDNVNYDKQIEEKQRQLAELSALTADVLLGSYDNSSIENNRLKSGNKKGVTPPPPPPPNGDKDPEKAYQSLYNTIRDLNYELDRQNEILSQKEDLDKIPILLERNDLIKKQQENLHALNEERRKELSKLPVTSDRYQELIEKIQDTSLEWWQLETAINSNKKAIEDINKAQQDLLDKQRKNLEDVQKEIANVIKKGIEDEIDEKEEALKKTKELLDDELDAYKKNIDEKIKRLDRLRDEEDFEKDQQKITDEISKLQNERNTLLMAAQSGDLTAINRIKEIDEELAKERENLDDLQRDREDDLRKQNLQDMLDEKEEKIKNAKEAAEREWEIEKAKYEQLLTEQSLYNEANKVLMESSVADITKMFEDLGLVIERDLLSKLKEVLDLINTVGKSNIKVNTNGTISLPQYANGTRNAIGGLSIVGERGAELINLPPHSQVIPNGITEKILTGMANFMPNLNMSMPKINTVGNGGYGDINLGGISIYTQTVDQNSVGNIVNQVATKFKQELNKSGIFRK